MWCLAGSIFAACKWLTYRRSSAAAGAPAWRRAAYLMGWPGLDADTFLIGPAPAPLPRTAWLPGIVKLAMGAALFFAARGLVPGATPMLAGWMGMIGVVLILHFGLFHLLSCAWRALGVDARPLMVEPLRSMSLSEFWGRRWNTAFRDLTHRFLFRPLVPRLGTRGALVVGFVFSGLVHDLVISMPAGGGYGGPTLFFSLQGVAMLLERSAVGNRLGLGRGFRGRAYTIAILLGPLYGLFHPPFVKNIVLPFMRALGAAVPQSR